MNVRAIGRIGSTLVLSLTLLACGSEQTPAPASGEPTAAGSPQGSGTTASSGGIPVFPDAKPIDSANPMASMVDMMKQELKKTQGANAQIDAYELPKDASFDKVKQFYTDALTKDGWTSADAMGAAAVPNGAVWIKTSGESFTVMSMDPSQNIILTISTTTK